MLFGQGLDQKTDDKVLEIGKLLTLENGVFKKRNRIDKRYGYDKLSSQTVDGTSLSGGQYLEDFNDELLQYNNQKIYSYSESTALWIDKGTVVPNLVETSQVVKNTASQSQCDSAVNGGVAVYAWEDSRGGIRGSIYDDNTNTPILVDEVIDASASRVRCVAFKAYIFVFYYKSGSLWVRRVTPATPNAFETAVEVSNTVNTVDPNYDIAVYPNNRIMFAHNVQGAAQMKVGWINETPEVLAGLLAPVTLSGAATDCLGIAIGPQLRFYVFYANQTNGLRVYQLNIGLGVLFGPINVDTYVATPIVNVTGSQTSTGVTCFYEISAADTYNQLVKTNTVTNAGSAGSAAVFLRSVGLLTKSWGYASRIFVGLTHESDLQSTYFVARDDGIAVSKLQPTVGGGLTTVPVLANISTSDNQAFVFSFTNKTRIVSENATIFTPLGVAKTIVEFDPVDGFISAQLGNNLHIAGGVLNMYDGQSIVEHGFHLYPENITYATDTGGAIANGTYQYVVVYEWTDNFGQIHRSTTSVPFSVTLSGGDDKIILTIPTLRITQKQGERTNVSIAVYRTEDAGEIFYRVSSLSSPLYNDVTVDTVDFEDTLVDSAIISNEILYTVGGVLDNSCAPSCSFIAVYKNRLFLTGLEDGNVTWYSKIHSPGSPVEFNADQFIVSESNGGRVTSIGILDDKILLFKGDRFFMTFGDGPNNTGQGGEFAEPQFITADAGCSDNKSIVRMPQGLMFKSKKGIYLLTSSLQLEYIGAPVESYNPNKVTSATLKSDINQIRFTLLDGPALVYDYYFGQWSTFGNQEANDALIWKNTYCVLRTNGFVYQENTSSFKDDFASYRLRIETGWIAVDSQVGFQRVYKFAILGEYKSKHKLRVRVYYDYSPASQTEYIFDPDTALDISHYGDKSPYGADSYYGGPNNSFRFTARLDRQKCQAIKFDIEDITVASTDGSQEAYTITAMGLLVGVKGTLGKFQASQQLAST